MSMLLVRRLLVGLMLSLACTGVACAANPDPGLVPKIHIEASRESDWHVVYQLATPAHELVFVRSNDKSRAQTWKVDDSAFEIVWDKDAEVARRKDGAVFTRAGFSMTPVFSKPPKDYAPFFPNGDGSMVFYSGRFFACGGPCPDDTTWSFVLDAKDWSNIIAGSDMDRGAAAWSDRGRGRSVYVGDYKPDEGPEFIGIFDHSLPESLRAKLESKLPEYAHYFANRLGPLESRVKFFVSYNAKPGMKHFQDGGSLPGQVFMHFEGDWADKMGDDNFLDSVQWTLAHEAAHQFMQRAASGHDSWIHEGAANLFASLAMQSTGNDPHHYARTRTEASAQSCLEALHGRTIRGAIEEGDYGPAYGCGMAVSLALHRMLLREKPESDGLFTVWKLLRERSSDSTVVTEVDYLDTLRTVGGDKAADFAHDVVRAASPDLQPEASEQPG